MQVSSASNAGRASISLALQSTRSQRETDTTVTAVGPHPDPQEYVSQLVSRSQAGVNLDSGTEKKLNRIKEIQVAFSAAKDIADSIESQYLLEPIV